MKILIFEFEPSLNLLEKGSFHLYFRLPYNNKKKVIEPPNSCGSISCRACWARRSWRSSTRPSRHGAPACRSRGWRHSLDPTPRNRPSCSSPRCPSPPSTSETSWRPDWEKIRKINLHFISRLRKKSVLDGGEGDNLTLAFCIKKPTAGIYTGSI